MKTTVLLTSSSPNDASHSGYVQCDKLLREVTESLRLAKFEDGFEIMPLPAARPDALRRAFLRLQNRPIIFQFFGHGDQKNQSLVFQNQADDHHLISAKAFTDLCRIFAKNLQCVVLTGCGTESIAQEVNQHVRYVIGMAQNIHQSSALEFSKAFYDGLAQETSIDIAFELGINAIRMAGLPCEDVPKIKVNEKLKAGCSRNQNQEEIQKISSLIEVGNSRSALILLNAKPLSNHPRLALLKAIALIDTKDPRHLSDAYIRSLEFVLTLGYEDSQTQRSCALLWVLLHQRYYQPLGIKALQSPKKEQLSLHVRNKQRSICFLKLLKRNPYAVQLLRSLNLS